MPINLQTPALPETTQTQDFLSDPPTWMMRYGIMVIGGFFSVLLILAYFIRYPDVIEAPIVLTTTHPPIRVMAQMGGRISEVLAQDQQLTQKGEVLMVMENTAAWRDVLKLETWLASADLNKDLLPSDLQLGNLQPDYSMLSQHWKDYHYLLQNPGTLDKIAALRAQIKQLGNINENLERQNAILRQEFVLVTKERSRQQQLHREKIISDAEFEKSEAIWLQRNGQIENANISILQNNLQSRLLDDQIQALSQTRLDTKNDKGINLAEDIRRLQSSIANWKQANLIVAPITGRVSLTNIWSAQQPISAGMEVLAILPEDKDQVQGKPSIIGRAFVSTVNSGKIQRGMQVVAYMDGFPALEFGAIEGQVSGISLLPQENGYLLEVAISDTLISTYGKRIPFRQEMPGKARIITEDLRMSERIFSQISNLLQNK